MEPLTWTGVMSPLNDIFQYIVLALFAVVVIQIIASFFVSSDVREVHADGTLAAESGALGVIGMLVNIVFFALLATLLVYLIGGIFLGTDAGIFGGMARQFLPVWIAMVVIFALSFQFKRSLGLYGKLFDSTVGMIGYAIVLFWVLVGVMGGPLDMLSTHDSLSQVSGMKNKLPGTPLARAGEGDYQWFLLGGDNLARDVFSRLIKGSWIVVQIAPLATLFAFMVGITLGLPAGYYGGFLDTVLSFLANLILAFPVILLFYLLVTPEIRNDTAIPKGMAAFLFFFPIVFFTILMNSRFHTDTGKRNLIVGIGGAVLVYIYLSFISHEGYFLNIKEGAVAWPGLPQALDLIRVPDELLIVFVAVVFVNSPTVFRIVRGLALDIKTRDYVAAAQTRGEGPWYIMLWEILPNARGPLIVDFCLRIGYTTILLGTLGFFGLGLESESPDWGSTINSGRRLLSLYPHAALAPALSLLSLVLGLNLLADGLREESLRD